jgi:hypothetical protein
MHADGGVKANSIVVVVVVVIIIVIVVVVGIVIVELSCHLQCSPTFLERSCRENDGTNMTVTRSLQDLLKIGFMALLIAIDALVAIVEQIGANVNEE